MYKFERERERDQLKKVKCIIAWGRWNKKKTAKYTFLTEMK